MLVYDLSADPSAEDRHLIFLSGGCCHCGSRVQAFPIVITVSPRPSDATKTVTNSLSLNSDEKGMLNVHTLSLNSEGKSKHYSVQH